MEQKYTCLKTKYYYLTVDLAVGKEENAELKEANDLLVETCRDLDQQYRVEQDRYNELQRYSLGLFNNYQSTLEEVADCKKELIASHAARADLGTEARQHVGKRIC